MALFGKILLFFNIVAAIAFFVLSGLDWSKRTDAQYQFFRGELIVYGLPLDGKDNHFRNADDGPLVDQFSPRALTETVGQAPGGSELGATGGAPVKTLLEEVERVKGMVKTSLDAAATKGAAEREAVLRKYLLDQVTDGQTRDELARRLKIPAEHEKLEAELMRRFDEAAGTGVPVAPSGSPKTEDDKQLKREQIAHLLIFLGPQDSAWQQRVAAVVGLKTYIPALDRQSAVVAAMADRARLVLRREQNNFLGEYQGLVGQARDQADRLADADRRLQREKDLLNEHNVTLRALTDRVNEFTRRLNDQRAQTKQSLDQQAGMERQIFEVLAEIVKTQDQIRQTERRLRQLEQQTSR